MGGLQFLIDTYAPQNAIDFGGNICCLLYTSDAADERSSVDLGGRRIIKKNNRAKLSGDGSY